MKHYLVTGGVGFIGYHLSHALLSQGSRVTIVDDFCNAPYPTLMKERNASDLKAAFPSVHIVHACITDTQKMTSLAQNSVDSIIHLAGLAGVRPSFKTPAHYAKVNVEGTMSMLEAVKASGVSRFVFASSSSVYGDATPLPASEEATCILPESPYAASKRSAELMVESSLKSMPHVHCAALRFFTVYGARQRPEMAITLFARAMVEGKAFTRFGDGSMKRDFTHVSDIVRGILLSEEKMRQGYRCFNVGSGSPIGLNDLIKTLAELSNTSPLMSFADKPLGDVDATYADISRAKKELSWEPKVQLREGLQTVLDWVKNNPSVSD